MSEKQAPLLKVIAFNHHLNMALQNVTDEENASDQLRCDMVQEVEKCVLAESVKYVVLGSVVQAFGIHEFREGKGACEHLHN
jgi:hypothetical protein